MPSRPPHLTAGPPSDVEWSQPWRPPLIRLRVDPLAPDPLVLARAADTIAGGGIVALPTDTFYGLAVDPRLGPSVDALYRIKERDTGQPVPVIAADEAQVERCVGPLTGIARRLARQYWPGPLTLVIEGAADLAAALRTSTGRVAVRVPAHAVARALPASVGFVVTSTSANLSGCPPPATADEVERALGSVVDLLLDGGPAAGGAPSTIIDATGSMPALLRAGAVAWERVLESIRST
jgi:L-threonylcarbamoyladenylate synthase